MFSPSLLIYDFDEKHDWFRFSVCSYICIMGEYAMCKGFDEFICGFLMKKSDFLKESDFSWRVLLVDSECF